MTPREDEMMRRFSQHVALALLLLTASASTAVGGPPVVAPGSSASRGGSGGSGSTGAVRPPASSSSARAGASALAVGSWPPGPDDPMAARLDVYPSEPAAVRAAGREAAAAAQAVQGSVGPQQDAGGLATVVLYPSADSDADWQPAVDALRDALPPDVKIDRRTDPPPTAGNRRPGVGEAWLVLAVRDRRREWPNWAARPVTAGRVEAVAYGPRQSRSTAARWAEKPWVDGQTLGAGGGDARDGRPGTADWVVGRARRPAGTAAEAERLALADAAMQFVGRFGIGSDPELNRFAVNALTCGRFVLDRSVRRYARSYGDVWDAAVLVDASPVNVQTAIADAAAAAREQRDGRRATALSTVVGGVGMMVVVGLLYAVVNAVTKGYLTRRLRVAALILLFGGLVVAAVVAGSRPSADRDRDLNLPPSRIDDQ